jgi:hypothetical protein
VLVAAALDAASNLRDPMREAINRPLLRLRWRLHGAWMWPAFLALAVLDGVIVHLLPPLGDSASVLGGMLVGVFLSLIGIVVLGPLLGWGLRRVRRDMPRVVARDYAGTAVVIAVSALLLALGLQHRQQIAADASALRDAESRALAYIGDRAPSQFRANLQSLNTFEVQPRLIYRVCVSNLPGTEDWCVIVDRSRPFGDSVRFAGHEPNSVLGEGTY